MAEKAAFKQGPPRPSMNVNLEDIEDHECRRCACPIIQGMRIKKVSVVRSPTGQEQVAMIPTFFCRNCGLELGQEIPKTDNVDLKVDS